MTVPILAELRAVATGGADPERQRRRVLLVIDRAIGMCEAANLADVRPAPAEAADLVERLQADAGERTRRPYTATAALDELFRLQEAYVRTRRYAGETSPALDSPERADAALSLAERIATAHAPDCAAGGRRWYWPRDVETLPCTCGGDDR